MSQSMCPHCGLTYGPGDFLPHPLHAGLVPLHDSPDAERDRGHACPGSGQSPRNPESDRRQLWNGEMSPAEKVELKELIADSRRREAEGETWEPYEGDGE